MTVDKQSEGVAMLKHFEFNLVTGLRIFAAFDALAVIALAWLVLGSDLFS